jgi:hypothetical protein
MKVKYKIQAGVACGFTLIAAIHVGCNLTRVPFVQYQAILEWNGQLPKTNATGEIPCLNLGAK